MSREYIIQQSIITSLNHANCVLGNPIAQVSSKTRSVWAQRVQAAIPTAAIPTNASEKAQLTLTLTLTVTLTP